MSTYRLTYGDDENADVTEILEGVEIEREDGLVVVFRDKEAILRLREEHVHALERIESNAGATGNR